MEMHQIRYFLAVAETLNFTKAAEQCHVTQPALSRAIQQLEVEVGGLLLRRERTLTHLTDLGRLMRPYLEQILRQSEAAKHTAKDFLTLERAPLKLGVMCTIGPMRFTGFLSEFHYRNPGVQLNITEGIPQRLGSLLESGELDVAIMAQPGAFPDRFDVSPLYRERFVLAVPHGHRFAARDTVAVRDLDGQDYVSRTNCEYAAYITDILHRSGGKMRIVYESEREDWIQIMVLAGLGVASFPEYSPLVSGLHTRPYVDPVVERQVSLVTVAGRRFSPALATFAKAVKAYEWPR